MFLGKSGMAKLSKDINGLFSSVLSGSDIENKLRFVAMAASKGETK